MEPEGTGRRGSRIATWMLRSAVVAGLVLALGAGYAVAAGIGIVNVLTPAGLAGFGSFGIAAGADGDVWLGEVTTGETPPVIVKVTPSGTISDYSGLPAAAFPDSFAVGPDGDMWFTDVGTPALGEINQSGTITEYPTGSGDQPRGLSLGATGTLWFTGSRLIGEISAHGEITTFTTGLPPYSDPVSIAAGSDGNMWFTDSGATPGIGRITPDGTITEFTAGLEAHTDPQGIALGPDGDMWFTDAGDEGLSTPAPAIGRITPGGTITEYSAGLTSDDDPRQIAAGADGNMWFLDNNAQAVWRITPDGTITKYSTASSAFTPSGALATGSDGSLWLSGLTTAPAAAVAQFDVGAPLPSVAPPSLSGPGKQGASEECSGEVWSAWAGEQPSTTAYDYDGYRWLRDGSPIAGETGPTYTPTTTDVGHQLSCKVTATYTLFPTTVSATSASVTVQSSAASGGAGGSGGGGGGGLPNLHVAVSAVPVPAAVGETFTYRFTLTNPGGVANATTLVVTLPSQVVYAGSRVDRGPGCVASGQTVSCFLDFFAPGQLSTELISARVVALGSATLTTRMDTHPQELRPSDSELSYTLAIGAGQAGSPSPAPGPRPALEKASSPALLHLSGLKTIRLQLKRPALAFTLKLSKPTRLTITLRARNGNHLASWHKHAKQGSHPFKLLLPPKAKHAGHDTLQILEPGLKNPKTFTVTLRP